jgi:hypothetical protein
VPESTYIPRHKGPPAEDAFDGLRQSGVAWAQSLAGNSWTDYNEHDPGVTLLEAVCYALTDVMYRADFPVEDFLVDANGQIQWQEQSLLPSEGAFPCRATTPLDYRSLILSSVPEVENARIDLVPGKDSRPTGLYRLLLRLNSDASGPTAQMSEAAGAGQSEQDGVVEKVRLVFARARNLCEDLESIEIIPSAEFKLHAEVEIREGIDPADVLARIYYVCASWLAAGIEFMPYDLALDRGKPPEEIFRGPFPESGMLVGDRGDPRTTFTASDVYSLIKAVDGVESVRTYPGMNGDEVVTRHLHWPQNDNDLGVRIFRNGRELPVSLHDFTMRYEEISFVNKGLGGLPTRIVPLPAGRTREISDYLSVQYHLPPIYGVGARGVPESATPREKARARQLKGYLLLFDQHMADYVAMLANLRRLFSTGIDKQETYFFQRMSEESFPGVTEAYDRESAVKLEELLRSQRSESRVTRLLDYLLALYGESFRDDILRRRTAGINREEEDAILDARIAYLENILTVTRDRGAAADYSRQPGDRQNRSGLEAKLSHLLGFEKEYQSGGTGLRVMEHILLRPFGGPFRISILFPGWSDRGQDPNFRKFAVDTVESACPAHIYADIYWLSRDQMQRFDHLHKEWWTSTLAISRIRTGQPLDNATGRASEAARELMEFLIRLESPDSYETSSGEETS